MIEFKQTNLLQSNAEALVNTVNTVGIMGKGIALQFKEKYPLNFKLYFDACKLGIVQTGKMFVTETGQLSGTKYIINFPTKTNWRSSSRTEYIEQGLDDLLKVIAERKITSIALPPLGCGNGGLDWKIVKSIIEFKLSSIAEKINVEVFEPGHHSYTRTTNAEAPKLTKARALILALAERYNVLGFDISHLEIQKLAYFLQEFGQSDLKLRFTKGVYGPYATNLKHLLAHLEGYYFKGQIRFQDMKPTDSLNLVSDRMKDVKSFLEIELAEEEKERLNKLSTLIEGFESPFGLELLSTVHWAKKELGINATEEKLKIYIEQWNARKKQIMSKEQISIAFSRINNYFA